jgi:integrase
MPRVDLPTIYWRVGVMKSKITSKLVSSLQAQPRPYQVHDTEIPGFIIRVQPSGFMTYLCYYRLRTGGRGRIVLGKTSVLTPIQARDLAKEVMADVVRGADPAAAKKRARQHTLENYIREKYEPWAKAHRKTGSETVAFIRRSFKNLLGRPLSDLSVWVIEKHRSERLKGGTRAVSINREVTALKASLSKAVEWGVLDANPLAKVKPLKIDQKGVVRFLSDDEEARLMAALQTREALKRAERARYNAWCSERRLPVFPDLVDRAFVDHLAPMVILSLNTGLRRGEVFQLLWRDVDLERGTVTVRGEMAKSGSTRHVPLNRTAREALAAWAKQAVVVEDALVFPNSEGKAFDNVKKAWVGLLRQADIESFRWHDMRHHFASRLVMAGVDLNTVRELLGHADLKMTLRYAHLAPHVKAAAVALLDRTPVESTTSTKQIFLAPEIGVAVV